MKRHPPREWFHSADDAKSYQRESLAYLALIYVTLGLSLSAWLPSYTLCFVVPWALSRQFLAVHELMHVRRSSQLDVVSRVYALFETPLSLGYDELQRIHLEHHRFAATERDPEWYQIRGGAVRSFLHAALAPEFAFVAWLRRDGPRGAVLARAALRSALGVALALSNPAVFLAYWLTVRTTITVSQFAFHYVLHHRGEMYGTFPLRPPTLVVLAARALIGARNVAIICQHDGHHAWPGVKALQLPGLLPAYPSQDDDRSAVPP